MFDIITGVDNTTLKGEMHDGNMYLHLDFNGKWSVSKYKKMLAQFLETLDYLKSKGILSVYVIIPSDDNKLLKFERMFGLVPLVKHGDSTILWRNT